jgi:hypothetical protein
MRLDVLGVLPAIVDHVEIVGSSDDSRGREVWIRPQF